MIEILAGVVEFVVSLFEELVSAVADALSTSTIGSVAVVISTLLLLLFAGGWACQQTIEDARAERRERVAEYLIDKVSDRLSADRSTGGEELPPRPVRERDESESK